MEILNSGSFVPLDNREKIEQLIFTAKTLATELSRTEGFQGSGPTNHQLGLEMWKGAEYMCRAHEEATIRNLFLSKFLEKLREIERQTAGQPSPSLTPAVNPTATHPPVSVQAQVATQPATSADIVQIALVSQDIIPAPQSQEVRDEYLGMISETLPTESDRPSYAAECVPEWEAAGADTNSDSETDETVATAVGESREDEPQEPTQSDIPQADEPAPIEADPVDVPESGSIERTVGEDVSSGSTTPGRGVEVASLLLSEKEPYNFSSCTVTAVIQLLPENEGTRKCVFSVRSHDFAPQITISDLPNGQVNEGIRQCLETEIGRYRTNLPALAAEKVKMQKPATKKRSSKADDKGTKASSASDEKKSVGSNVPPVAQSAEAAKNQQNLFAS